MRRRAAPPHPRHAFDWYVEPRWAVEDFFDAVPLIGTVGDPACGIGTIPEVAGARGHEIVASDIVDRGYARMAATEDFLAGGERYAGVANIVMNPPYGYRPAIAEHFVRRALALASSAVAVVVPIDWLASETRFRLFTEHPPAEILVHSSRPSMPPGDRIEALGARAFRGGRKNYCWVVWLIGRRGVGATRFLPPRAELREPAR